MNTDVLSTTDPQKRIDTINRAAKLLKAGELVAFPTETVYGLGADALNPKAVAKIYAAKGRPADNPLIVHISDRQSLQSLVTRIPDTAHKLMEAFWPGPLSIVFPKQMIVPDLATGGLSTVVVRFPSHPLARDLICAAGTPIAAPSANLSGRVSPTTAQHVLADLDTVIPLILDAGQLEFGLESTVIDCTQTPAMILRPGSITKEDIEAVIGNVALAEANTKAASPGMKYRHYAPITPLTLLTEPSALTLESHLERHRHDESQAILWHTGNIPTHPHTIQLPADPRQAAPLIFDSLRKLDQFPVDTILVQGFPLGGIGTAIMNRLEKAAHTIL